MPITVRGALFRKPSLNFVIRIGGKRTHRQVLPININGIGIVRDVTYIAREIRSGPFRSPYIKQGECSGTVGAQTLGAKPGRSALIFL